MASPHKPWKAEYAKSSRSSCKTCKSPIDKETLRLGKMVQATQFDGFMPVSPTRSAPFLQFVFTANSYLLCTNFGYFCCEYMACSLGKCCQWLLVEELDNVTYLHYVVLLKIGIGILLEKCLNNTQTPKVKSFLNSRNQRVTTLLYR